MQGQQDNRTPSAVRQLRHALGAAWRFVRHPRTRSETLTRLLAPRRIHQDSSLSWPDRYPQLFAAAHPNDRIDGAGRSSSSVRAAGEEVVTLRHYFPGAMLTGAEINRGLLRACHRLPPDPRRRFIHSTHAGIAACGPYDAIFAMAVLTRRPHLVDERDMRNIADFYPYAHFEQELRFLAAQLVPGGLLIVEHSLYRAEDALAGIQMEAMIGPGTALAKGRRFDPDGNWIQPQPIVARIFRKRAA